MILYRAKTARAALDPLKSDMLIWSWWANDDMVTSFAMTAAGDAGEIAVGICALQPELCVAVVIAAGVYTIYVAYPAIKEFVNVLREKTSRILAPVRYASYNPGKDANGNCTPCDPSKYKKWRGSNDDHWHWIDWNQDQSTCMCFPDGKSGPDDPGPRWDDVPR